jgi:hypothetical protein
LRKAALGPQRGCLEHVEAIHNFLLSNTSAMATTNTAPQMLSTFEPFERLPTEIRHESWKLTLPSFASTVKIHIDQIPCLGRRPRPLWNQTSPAKRDIPPLLHCCRESRAVALKYYKLGFKVKSQRSGTGRQSVCRHEKRNAKLNRQLYWDPREDSVSLKNMGKGVEESRPLHEKRRSCQHYVTRIDPGVRKIEIVDSWPLFHDIAKGFSALERVTVLLRRINGNHDLKDIPVALNEKTTEIKQEECCRLWKQMVQQSLPPGVESEIRLIGA